MKKGFVAILLLVFIGNGFASSNNQLKYRIQCATSSDKDLLDELHKIPELAKFTLPSGSRIFFSGGYYDKLEEAQQRLQKVQNVGFKSAFIRVFKHNNMLSKPVGDRYIKDMAIKVAIEQTKKDSAKLTSQISKKETQKIYTRAEVEALKKKALARKIVREKLEKAKEASGAEVNKEIKDTVKVEEKKQEKEDLNNGHVDEPPVYKIFVAKTALKDEEPAITQKLLGEIVYSYTERDNKIYTVGFYGNEAAAIKDLKKFKSITPDAKIIGVYKGKIISLKLANELYAQFNAQKK